MCSLNDYENDIDGDLQSDDATGKDTTTSMCKKCRCKEPEVFLKNDGYCNLCFIMRTTHKFRAALGKSKIIRRGDSVLVGHSGKANSTTLLHLIKSAMHQTTHKRLVLNIKVLYIDEGIVKGQTLPERQATLNAVSEQIKTFGFPGYATSLNQCLNERLCPEIYPIDVPHLLAEKDETLMTTFNALTDDTAREELKQQLRHRLLMSVAKKLDCNKVFTANSSTDAAVKVLSNISLGRGAQLSLDIGFADTRYKDVMLLRPIQEFTKEEITQYLKYHNISECQCSEQINQGVPTSIQSLTESFVSGLENQFCGTVSTIFRTADKLSTQISVHQDTDYICILCNACLDTNCIDSEISAIQATAFSRLMSLGINIDCSNNDNTEPISTEIKISEEVTNVNNYTKNSEYKCAESNLNNVLLKNIKKHLCYGCRLTFRNLDVANIPMFIRNAVQERVSLISMQKEISDFLL